MDMKTIYRIFKSVGLALIALWMVSCQDLLTEDPKGQLAVTNFFNSKGDLDLALNGMYSKVASDMYANIWAGFESVMGDDISTHPAANKQGLREVDTYNVSDNNTWVTELWGARWRLVKAANFIIDNAGRTPEVSHEEKDALYGTRRIEANPRLPEKRHMVPSHIKRQGEAMNAGPLLPLVRQSRKQTAHALCRCRASRQVTSTSKVSPATHTPSGRGDMPPAPSPN